MNKHTYQERLCAGLLALGKVELLNETTKKYRVFQQPGSPNKTYVGKFGALRHGTSVSSSCSIGCPTGPSGYYHKVLHAGDEALAALDTKAPGS